MSTKLKNMNINPEFEDMLSFKSEEEKIEHEAQMISYRILSELEKMCDERKIKKKDLAEMTGTSKSYITQLFNGTKSINTYIMAKFENALDISFEIKLRLNEESYGDFLCKQMDADMFSNKRLKAKMGTLYFFQHSNRETKDIVNRLETENETKQVA
jgi:transcriptional regulator with XRE-family HTH domain